MKHAVLGEGRLEKNDNGCRSTDVFGPVDANSGDSILDEEEPEEEQEKD